MHQGLYINYRYFPMRSRADVGDPELQRALQEFHGDSHRVQCACGFEAGADLPMEAICQRTPRAGQHRYRVDRRSTTDPHHSNCIFRRNTDRDQCAVHNPTAGLFLLPRLVKYECILQQSAAAGGRWTGFTQYARRLWSVGYTRAFVETNREARSPLEVRNPCAEDILLGIEAETRNWKFSGGLDGFSVAESMGLSLVNGVADWDLRDWVGGETSTLDTLVHAWVAKRGRLFSSRFIAPVRLLSAAADSVMVFGNPLKAPFLFQAVVENGNRLRFLVLKTVLYDGYDLVFSDSAGEAGFYRQLLNSGRSFYRALDSLADYERMVPAAAKICALPAGAVWPCNPDCLVYGDKLNEVVECRGFTEGDGRVRHRVYHERFDRKADLLRRVLDGTTACFREEISAEYRDELLSRTCQGGRSVVREYPEQPLVLPQLLR